jgi:DNA-binding NarL/FixJ family response regulator
MKLRLHNKAIRVACVEDDQAYRALLEKLLAPERGFDLMGVFKSAEQAVRPLLKEQPDVVLLDVGLPGWTGIDCLRALGLNMPSTAFVILTGHDAPQHVFAALKAGACGYMLKTSPLEHLLEGVRSASCGGGPLSPEISRLVISSFHEKSSANRKRVPGITPRESELLNLLMQGFSAKEAAHEMHISYETARDYLKTIYQKLNVHSRTEAVLKYIELQKTAAFISV